MEFADLKHARRDLPSNGKVVVLDTGALITPEAGAMLQALHSRSIGGIDSHLLKLVQRGAKQFMDTYYVGYGDKSIGDCGSITIFIEGVSMLVAKAIQDSQLYNGQESSTRYIDFSQQAFGNPTGSSEGDALLESLREFHLEGLRAMKEELALRHPRLPQEDERVWQKAINARAFDIMRGFLPAGAATNLAWHAELRQVADHLLRLRNHPLEEVRDVAVAATEALDEMYPSSFKQKRHEKTERYVSAYMQSHYYFNGDDGWNGHFGVALERDNVDRALLTTYAPILASRPNKTEPPKHLAECGSMQFSFLLDFGSFRDLQRHRAIVQRMPLLTDTRGFSDWYFEQMPRTLQVRAKTFLASYSQKLAALKVDPTDAQYFIPMGYNVTCRITGDLPALLWLVELRSGISVHPTLRKVAQNIGAQIARTFKEYDLAIYLDLSEDRFNITRGTQDIVEKAFA